MHTISDSSFDNLLALSTVYIAISNRTQSNKSSCGWVISDGQKVLYSGKLFFGEATNNTPIRALLLGIIGSTHHYAAIYATNICPRPSQSVKIITNNKFLIYSLESWKYTMKTASKQFLIEHENVVAAKSLLKLQFKNADIILLKDIDKSDKIIMKDLLSCSARHAYNASSMCNIMNKPLTDYHRATVYIQHKEVNSDTSLELTNSAQTPFLRIFLQQKYNWDSKTINLIDWEVHNRALQGFKSVKRKTLLQFINRWLPTNAHPAVSTPITPICPTCLLENETNDHFLTCNHDTYRIAWKEDVAAWYEHSQEINLEPILTYYILQVFPTMLLCLELYCWYCPEIQYPIER